MRIPLFHLIALIIGLNLSAPSLLMAKDQNDDDQSKKEKKLEKKEDKLEQKLTDDDLSKKKEQKLEKKMDNVGDKQEKIDDKQAIKEEKQENKQERKEDKKEDKQERKEEKQEAKQARQEITDKKERKEQKKEDKQERKEDKKEDKQERKEEKKEDKQEIKEQKKEDKQERKEEKKEEKQERQDAKAGVTTPAAVPPPAPTTTQAPAPKKPLWKTPNKALRYDQVTFLVAHNAFASAKDGWKYTSQNWKMLDQLYNGVRGFMLTTHDHLGKIALCLGGCTKGYQNLKEKKPSTSTKYYQWQTLKEALEIMHKWLKANPQEIVTIFLHDQTEALEIDKVINSIKDLNKLIFTESYWNFNLNDGYWPTLEKMVADNKRLIIFTDSVASDYTLYQWEFMIENQDGTTDLVAASAQRIGTKADRKSRLFLLNYFNTMPGHQAVYTFNKRGQFPSTFNPTSNDSQQLKALITSIQTNVFGGQTKNPNFIALDFVDQGNAFNLINELNDQAALSLPPKK